MSASVALAASGLWKRYQDLDDLAFVQAELRKVQMSEGDSYSADAVHQRLASEHRNSLLIISRKEQALREMDGNSAPGLSLRESIERDVMRLVSIKQVQSFAPERPANVNEVEYYTMREHDAHEAMNVDLILVGASIICAVCAVWMWFVELKRLRRHQPAL